MRGRVQRSGWMGTPHKNVKATEIRAQRSRTGEPLTPETEEGYLEHLKRKGWAQGTIDSYRRKIRRLYGDLPEDGKAILDRTLGWWRDKLDAVADAQPELTRSEYLRLLSTARSLEREQVYLLVRLFWEYKPAGSGAGACHGGGGPGGEAERELQLLEGDHLVSGDAVPGAAGVHEDQGDLQRPGFSHPEREADRPDQRDGVYLPAVPGGQKGSPRAAREGIERNVTLLVEQGQDRLMEKEQMEIWWDG